MNGLRCFALVVLTALFSVAGFCFNAKIACDDNRKYIVSPDHQLLFKNNGEKEWRLFEPLANVQVTAISIGGFNNKRNYLALDAEGHVWAWGRNKHGELGLSDTTNRQDPTIIPEISNIVGIIADSQASLAWDQEGNLWGFGPRWFDILNVLGRGEHHLTPKKIPDLPPIKDVKIGSCYAMAIGVDGAVWVWGNNSSGCIGCGPVEKVDVPISIQELPPIIQISAETGFSFLLDEQNNIWAAGRMLQNHDSPMGDNVNFGNTFQRFYDLRAKEIATSCYSVAAIDFDDTLVIWGLVGKRDYDWEFVEIPRRIERIKAHSVFFFRGNLYVITLKNKIEKYRHNNEDEIEASSRIICGNPIATVKKSYRD